MYTQMGHPYTNGFYLYKWVHPIQMGTPYTQMGTPIPKWVHQTINLK
jgi:hypothetical protein